MVSTRLQTMVWLPTTQPTLLQGVLRYKPRKGLGHLGQGHSRFQQSIRMPCSRKETFLKTGSTWGYHCCWWHEYLMTTRLRGLDVSRHALAAKKKWSDNCHYDLYQDNAIIGNIRLLYLKTRQTLICMPLAGKSMFCRIWCTNIFNNKPVWIVRCMAPEFDLVNGTGNLVRRLVKPPQT
jgi:hypothetical protein